MRDLEGAQQPAREQLMRRQAGDVLAVEEDLAAVGANVPATMLNSVDLPAPFGPISPVIEPFSTFSEQSSTASKLPKRLLTF